MRVRSRALFRGRSNRRGAKDMLRREVRVIDGHAGGETCARERERLLRLVMVL